MRCIIVGKNMYIAYVDESGDDGNPGSSESFVLTSVYMHYEAWRGNLDTITAFRRQLRQDTGLHISTEMHMRSLLLGKKPYHHFRFGRRTKREISFAYYEMVAGLALESINVVIVKKNVRNDKYRVLDTALTYNAQRIANDIHRVGAGHRFLIVTDEGRVGSMRSTVRRIQRYNDIPSRYSSGGYRSDLGCLIEDPLPKDSQQPHFIQVADGISFLVSLYAKAHMCHTPWPNRIKCISYEDVITALDNIIPILNLKACNEPYGIVNYPKA